MCVLPLPHSFETSPELLQPGLFHTPAGRDDHRPPDSVGAAAMCTNNYHKKYVVVKGGKNRFIVHRANFPSQSNVTNLIWALLPRLLQGRNGSVKGVASGSDSHQKLPLLRAQGRQQLR